MIKSKVIFNKYHLYIFKNRLFISSKIVYIYNCKHGKY